MFRLCLAPQPAGCFDNHYYDIVVPIKGVADFDNKMHAVALQRMERLYGAKAI